jgi:hypothetical protein
MSVEVHYQSVEVLHVPVIRIHPTTGPVALSGETVEVALPTSSAAPSVWVVTAWASGTSRKGDDRWYMAELEAAKERGEFDVKIPGLGEPSVSEYLTIRGAT